MLDSAHKLLSPSTYECKLCELTYGLVKEKKAWKEFRETSREEMLFLHRDEFERQYAQRFNYPFVARVNEKNLELLLSGETLGAITMIQ